MKESTLALKHRADITRSPKQGYQWPHKMDLSPPTFFLKKGFDSHILAGHGRLAELEEHHTSEQVMVNVVSSIPNGGNFIFC